MPRKKYWLMKSEPDVFSIDDLAGETPAEWEGVRNYQARNYMREMKKGDLVLFYHSNEGKEVVGIAKVTAEAYPDPTSDDPRWVVVDLAPLKPLERPVGLAEIKTDRKLAGIALVKQSRLSVMPIEKRHFDRILQLGGTRAR